MGGSFVMTGVSGSVWVGCEKAADLGAWTFTRKPGGNLITAAVLRRNEFYGRRKATDLRLMVGRKQWRWRNSAVEGVADSGTYRVTGPPEET